MSVNEKFEPTAMETAEPVTPAAETAARTPEKGEGESMALGIAFGGFAEAMETKGARMALTATKVLLFNAVVFLPLIAMGFLLFS
jgi:hypothetical protein